MKKSAAIAIMIALLIALAAGGLMLFSKPKVAIIPINETSTMNLSSPAFSNEGDLPKKYACDGEKMSPPLAVGDVPMGAKSLALVVEDPDAPSGMFTHWTVWNINPAITEIGENSVPSAGIEGKTSANSVGYVSPCPPSGTHRYYFRMYAINNSLDLARGASVDDLKRAMKGRVLDSAELMARYAKQ